MNDSLRRRLFLTLAAAVALSTVLTVAVTAVLVRHGAQVQAQRTLERQADALVSVLAPRAGSAVYTSAPLRRGGIRRVGAVRAAAILAAVPPSGDHFGTVTVAATRLMFAERGTSAGVVVLIRPARLGAGDPGAYLLGLILAGLGGALVAAALAFLLARRLVRPLNELALAAGRVVGQREAVEVPVRGPRELAELALTFNHMSHELTAARESQRAFLLSVSHELKTPLTAIRGYAEGLQDEAVAPRAAGDVILAEATRLARLVGDLLDLARLDRPEFAVEREQIDLREIGEQAVERFAAPARAQGLRLELHGEGPALAWGDHGRVLQVLSNLLENALNVTPSGGVVSVGVQPSLLSVSDTGPGIDAEDLPHAFERFYLHARLGGDGRRGSGLGLAIVRQLAEVIGASVEVRSTVGEGSTFTFRLPAV